ncbi:heterokaryon incompatibility protein-domain-containing protein [Xylaria acuta]|nr:heterokaryon incompatibility protein-domain-containing protein [Xylaria acuta]
MEINTAALVAPYNGDPDAQIMHRYKAPKPRPYYNYTTLPEGWIRLLRIHDDSINGALDNDLHVTLYDYPLSSCPDYIALSYTWGEPSPIVDPTYRIFTQEPRCFPIGCGGYLLRATRNLRDALRRLREGQQCRKYFNELGQGPNHIMQTIQEFSSSPGLLDLYWIDSLCIDQDDLFERSAQVSLMGTIYKKTQLCLVWLGEQNQDTRSAMKLALELSNNAELYDAFAEMMISPAEKNKLRFRRMFSQVIHGLPEERMVALAVLLSHTWFSRVWVLQEVALSSKVLVQCGSQVSQFGLLIRLGLYFATAISFCGFGPSFKAITQKLGPGTGSRGSWTGTQLTLATLHSVKEELKEGAMPSFLRVMDLAAETKSTDPRDKIYGLLAITAEFQLDSGRTLSPDYTLPVHVVYLQATSYIATQQNSLGFLRLVCSPGEKLIKGLPSWCPDYTNIATSSYKGGRAASLWSSQLNIEVVNNKLLVVCGFCYDTVNRTTCDPKDLLGLALKIRQNGDADRLRRNKPTRVDSLWRFILQDELYNVSPAPKVAGLYFPAMVGMLIKMPDITSPSEKQGVIDKELNDWRRIITELRLLEPESRPFLPNVELMQEIFCQRCSTNMGLPEDTDPKSAYSAMEIASVPQRAKEAGLTTELEQLLESNLADTSELDYGQAQVILRDIIMQGLMRTTAGKCFFTTQKAEGFGAAKESVRTGDQVWILHDAPTPVILRLLENGNYEYLGDAYVDGTMNDGIKDAFKPQEVQRVSIQ